MRQFTVFIFLLSYPFFMLGQTPNAKPNIDSIILSWDLHSDHDVADLADTLTYSFNDDSLKVRALYMWVTENIAYDVVKFTKDANITLEVSHAFTDPDYLDKQVWHTLSIHKGICQDYADLFCEMCKSIKINCVVVTGYGASFCPNWLLSIQAGMADHAWNAVNIHNKWYLIDLTWASGSLVGNKFVKSRDDHYYLTPPNEFIKDHLPDDDQWQLLDKPLTRKEFVQLAKQQ